MSAIPPRSNPDDERPITRAMSPITSQIETVSPQAAAPDPGGQSIRHDGLTDKAAPSSTGFSAQMMHLRNLRAEVQDLRAALQAIRNGDAPLKQYVAYIDTSRTQIKALIDTLHDDDEIIRIKNAWEMMETVPIISHPTAQETLNLDAQTQGQYLVTLLDRSRTIVAIAGRRTIPERLKEWLRNMQPGDSLPFHAIFKDEVLDDDDRREIVTLISYVPDIYNQVVSERDDRNREVMLRKGVYIDADNGMIYCYDRSAAGRYAAVRLIAGLWLVITLGVPLLSLLPQLQTTTGAGSSLLIGWLGVSAGLLVHIIVAMRKRLRTPNGTLPSLKRMPNIIAAKQTQILLQLLIAFIGFMGFVFVIGLPVVIRPTTQDAAAIATASAQTRSELGRFLFNAFLVGYSLDSFVELFTSSLDSRVGTLQSDVAKRIGM